MQTNQKVIPINGVISAIVAEIAALVVFYILA